MEPEAGQLLSDVIADFPYFQSAHMLYLKHLSKEKSSKYAPQLKIAATYANDRKKLYELVIQEDLKSKIKIIEPEDETTDSENKISPLEEEILKEAVNASIQLEVAKPTEPELKNMDHELDEPTVVRPLSKTGKKTFNDWLTALPFAGYAGDANKEKTSSDGSLIDSFIADNPKIGSLPSHSGSGELKDLKANFFSPINTARLSIVDDDSFVTVTLAKIYETQHFYDKAIKAYEILSLKYPEKRNTFAARIDFLKKEKDK